MHQSLMSRFHLGYKQHVTDAYDCTILRHDEQWTCSVDVYRCPAPCPSKICHVQGHQSITLSRATNWKYEQYTKALEI